MTDLSEMPTRELVTMLHLATATGNGEDDDLMHEAARRLERYAPVRIDPEDESTWPTKQDADYRDLVEVWDTGGAESRHQWEPKKWSYRLLWQSNSDLWWRRINNEPPE